MWTLVTGGAKKFGAALCKRLAKKGHNIVVHYKESFEEALLVAQDCREWGVKSEILRGDFSSKESTQNFIEEYKRYFPATKLVVNNVGIYIIASALKTQQDDWSMIFQTNLHAPFMLIRSLASSLRGCKGNIINIGAAGLNSIRADVYSTAYTITKQSLWILTKSLAKEFAPDGVRVNMISPGHLEYSVDLPKDFSSLLFSRPSTLEELLRAVLFFADDASSHITGQNLEVAGGARL